MKILPLLALVMIPVMLMAQPAPGSPAPDVVVYDTSGVAHNLISSSSGHVIHIFFCWSS